MNSEHTSGRPDALPLTLELVAGAAAPASVPLGDGSTVVGREPESSDVALGKEVDGHLSARHFRIDIAAGAVRLTDLNSSNGTYVRGAGDGQAVQVSTRVLRPGDEIYAGNHTFRVEGLPEPAAPARPYPSRQVAGDGASGTADGGGEELDEDSFLSMDTGRSASPAAGAGTPTPTPTPTPVPQRPPTAAGSARPAAAADGGSASGQAGPVDAQWLRVRTCTSSLHRYDGPVGVPPTPALVQALDARKPLSVVVLPAALSDGKPPEGAIPLYDWLPCQDVPQCTPWLLGPDCPGRVSVLTAAWSENEGMGFFSARPADELAAHLRAISQGAGRAGSRSSGKLVGWCHPAVAGQLAEHGDADHTSFCMEPVEAMLVAAPEGGWSFYSGERFRELLTELRAQAEVPAAPVDDDDFL